MHANTFLKQFNPITSGAGGIQKLRELVLKLAVRGQLTSPLPDDDSVSLLIRQASERIQHDIENGVAVARKASVFDTTTPPFAIPESWEWVRLDTIASYIQRGKSPTYAEAGHQKIISQKCIQWAGFTDGPCRWLDASTFEKYGSERVIRDGDLLWNSTGTGTIGRVNVFKSAPYDRQVFVADSHVTVVRLAIGTPRYIWCYLASPDIQKTLEGDASGSTNQVELSTSYVRNTWIPLPPLNEQKRIVSKVDELMALCDELEERQEKHNTLKRAAAASVLHNLTEAKTPRETAERWSRLSIRFGELFNDLETIKALRGAIADHAVLGRLVTSTDSENGQAEVTALRRHRIDAARKNLIPKKLAALDSPKADEFVPTYSKRWGQTRLGELALSLDYGTSEKASALPSNGVLIYGMGQIKEGLLTEIGAKFLDRGSECLPALYLNKYDLLFNRTNSYALVGKTAVYLGEDEKRTFASYLIRVRLDIERVEPQFISLYINSPYCRRTQIEPEITQQTNQANYNGTKLANIVVPFPALAEQRRIVAKVRELTAICDRLEDHIRDADRLNAELMASLIHVLTDGGPGGGASISLLEPSTGFGEQLIGTAPIAEVFSPSSDPNTSEVNVGNTDFVASPLAEVDVKFKEAVLVGAIVKAFFKAGGEPIGNFRLQKAVYFARRHIGEHALNREFARKAAGPYNPSMKYSGGIAIAKERSWLREARGRYGFGHVPSIAIGEIDQWVDTYGYDGIARWVAEQFRFKKNEDWETLATVDYAIEHMRSLGIEPDARMIIDYIRSDDEWRPKIEKLRLNEFSVQSAIIEIKALFGA